MTIKISIEYNDSDDDSAMKVRWFDADMSTELNMSNLELKTAQDRKVLLQEKANEVIETFLASLSIKEFTNDSSS